ncbi:MAG: hypothetical protein U0790_05600 [Isosphaeraceae bacterium]
MNAQETRPRPPWRIDLVEIGAIVAGYGLAALLFRAFWPSAGVSVAMGLFAIGFYLWLGLAMSGPLLLLRRGPAAAEEEAGSPRRDPAGSRTWAEMAWLMIGVYWIVLGVFVLPIRLHSFRMGDTLLFGAIPLAAGLVMRFVGPRPRDHHPDGGPWTHQVAVALLVTWPPAWICLVVLAADAF